MVCDQCGTDNPEVNRFCGACGAALFRRPELWKPLSERQRPTSQVEAKESEVSSSTAVLPPELAPKPVQEPVIENTTLPSLSMDFEQQSSEPVVVTESQQYTPISGPSLLGLSGAPEYEESDDSTYLVGEETPRRRVGWFIFGTVAIAVLIGFAVLEYKTIKTGAVKIPWLTSNSESSKSAERQQTADDISAPAESQPATPQPLTSNEAPAPASPSPSAPQSGAAASSHAAASPQQADATKTGDLQQPTMEVTQKKLPEPPVSTPEQPAEKTSDQASTQAATARGAEQAASKRKQEMAAAINKDEEPTPDADSAPAPKAVSAPTRTLQTADPRQNRLLLTGERFLYGRGGHRDCNQAVAYFREAAKQYNGPAMSHLGAMYASGNCVQQNRLEAYKWFSRAQEAQPNNQWLGRNMNMLWRQMTPQERASVSR